MVDIESLQTHQQEVTRAVQKLKTATTGATTAWNLSAVAEARTDLEKLDAQVAPATTELIKLTMDLQTGSAKIQEVAFPKAEPNYGVEARADLIRLGIILIGSLGLGFLARWRGLTWGWGPIVLADAYILVILLGAGLRSDRTYVFKNGLYLKDTLAGKWLYQAFPSKAAAIFFVAGLFLAIWLGFADLYRGYINPDTTTREWALKAGKEEATPRPFLAGEARSLSFLTLATFDGPGQLYEGELRVLVLFELASAIFLILGIFALLINRISELD